LVVADAEHLAKRKEVLEAMREKAQRVAESEVSQLDPPQSYAGQLGGARPQEQGFASSTTAATGKSKETINRAIRRASEVCQEARDLIGTDARDAILGMLQVTPR